MIKSVLFDLDGIIVDSEPLHFEAHQKALRQFGVNITIQDYMEFGVAKGDANLFEKVSKKYGVELNKEKVSKSKKKLYKEIFCEKAVPREGVLDLIKNFSERYALAITSSGAGDIIDFVIDKFSLGNKFKAIISGDDVKKVKPHPDIYEKALGLLELGSTDCIAVEDSESGLLAAKGAGIKCIVVPCDFTKEQNFSIADYIFEGFEEITSEFVDSL
ncbi:MAG: HAD family phosphatase [Patescibacteria group bacterium]|nr:HAD family phosphatase [Patescibacteria group bacterium]